MPAFRPPINKLIVVDRDRRMLTLYKRPIWSARFRKHRVYKVAVGSAGHETPRGLYLINTRAKDPEWMMPFSDWVPKDLQGTVIPGGAPENPLKLRWLGITDPKKGIGIHGTADEDSIGRAASHGCIRMRGSDVKELYGMVPKHTPIYIV